jgi:hypothetical protein
MMDAPRVSRLSLWAKAQRWFGQPTDALPVRVFEVAFVLAFLLRMGRNLVNWREWLTEEGLHLTAEEYATLGYPEPLPLLEPWMVVIFATAMFGAGVLVMLNRHRRIALWVLLATAIYAQGVDYMGSFAYNKIFIAHFALLATGPGYYRDTSGRLMAARALPFMLQLSVVTIYFTAGLAKAVNGDWLNYDTVLWTHAQGFHRTEMAAWMLRELPAWSWAMMQHVALGFELLAPLIFFWGRTRWVAIGYGLLLHLMIALLMSGLIYFSAQMWAFYALFVTAAEWKSLSQILRPPPKV